jgi:hypothetical protein
MDKTTKLDLSPTTENNPKKSFFQIGDNFVCIINKAIAEKLGINNGSICEQKITDDGNIILRIKKFKEDHGSAL